MKTVLYSLIAVLVVCSRAYAGAPTHKLQTTGPALYDYAGSPLQVMTTKPSTIKNSTITGTKGFVNHSAAALASVFRFTCTDGNGNSLPCRIYPNGQATYIPNPAGEGIRGIHPDVRYWRFGKYSTTSATDRLVVTTEQQKP
jgi:hypothetical protein